MEENKTTTVVETKKEEKKEGFLSKFGNFVRNPAKGRPIKNAGWMLGGAGALMVLASILANKNGSTENDSDDDDE